VGSEVENGGMEACSWGVAMSRTEKVNVEPNFRRFKIVSLILGEEDLGILLLDAGLSLERGKGLADGGCEVGPCASKLQRRSKLISRKFMTKKTKESAATIWDQFGRM